MLLSSRGLVVFRISRALLDLVYLQAMQAQLLKGFWLTVHK